MGLLDWLTEGIGSDMGGGSAVGAGMPPLPPVQQTGTDAPPLAPPMPPAQPRLNFQRPEFAGTPPLPPAEDPMTAGGAPPNGPGLPPTPPAPPMAPPVQPPVPMPAPRPPGAGALPPLPPAAGPTGGAGMPPGPPLSLAPDMHGPAAAPLDRSIGGGLDQNKMRGIMGALGGGLKAAGNSAGKSPFQAFTSGAGEGLEGGEKSQDKGYDQRLKSLQLAVQAQRNGDTAAYNKNYAAYLKGKLEADTSKATPGARSAWNKPDSQKFIDAQNALAKDPEVHASQKMLEKLASTGDEAAIAKATATHNALIQQKQGLYLAGVGLNPQTIAQNMKTPPGTPQNPHVVMNKADFDTYVKPGQAYKNPADGKIYIRKETGAKEAPAAEAAPTTAPAPPGPMPGTAAPVEEE